MFHVWEIFDDNATCVRGGERIDGLYYLSSDANARRDNNYANLPDRKPLPLFR